MFGDDDLKVFLAGLGAPVEGMPRDFTVGPNVRVSYGRDRPLEDPNEDFRRFDENIFTRRPKEHKALKVQTIDSKIVYKHINEHPYQLVDIPDVMAKRSRYELDPTTAGPLKTPFGPESGMGFFTINWMIQSYAQKVPFRFANWRDMASVVKWLGEYVLILDKDIKEAAPEMEGIKDQEILDRFSEAQGYFHMAVTFYDKIKANSERMEAFYKVESTEVKLNKIAHEKRLENIGLRPKHSEKKTNLPSVRDWFEKMNRT